MNELMAPKTVAQQYGVPVDQLARWRRQNRGPAYYTLTRRTIRYDPDSVHAWFHQPGPRPLPPRPLPQRLRPDHP